MTNNESESSEPLRHPQRLDRESSALVVIDMQDRILAAIPERSRVIWNARRVLDAAHLFDIPTHATEQYPEKLGGTTSEIAERLAVNEPKRRFSAIENYPIEFWAEAGCSQVVVIGIETHVCVLQTVLDLLAESFVVQVVVDAVSCRHALDHEIALRAMETAGAVLCTTESVLFQWCDDSQDEHFKAISALVRETPPSA